ncbi:hypothetical protein N9L19_00755 [bacterium]|nr:hypothetical protein [bacterium]
MYAELNKWFVETSGLGLTEQADLLMDPKSAAKEADVADAIEVWEEKVNRLAKHGDEYRLPEIVREAAFKHMIVSKIRGAFELWEAEKLSFEEPLEKAKGQSRAKKVDTDAQKGKSGVAMGPNLGITTLGMR